MAKNQEIKHIKNYDTERIITREERTNPTIQMITPTTEIIRQRKAKGRPKRKPRGRQSPSPQHILSDLLLELEFLSLLVFCFYHLKVNAVRESDREAEIMLS